MPDDGLKFKEESVRGSRIRQEARYEAVRSDLQATLGTARIRVQVDIGLGDHRVPEPEIVELPCLLGEPPVRLLAYRRETVVAEKLEALVSLGAANSRMKDFFDLFSLASEFAFEGVALLEALSATFERRGTELPVGSPVGLTNAFATDAEKQAQWRALRRRAKLETAPQELASVVGELRQFLLPPLEALKEGQSFQASWPPGGPWRAWAGGAQDS